MVNNGVNAGEVGDVEDYVDELVLGVRFKETVTGRDGNRPGSSRVFNHPNPNSNTQ